MGFKLSMILVKPVQDVSVETLLPALGFHNPQKQKSSTVIDELMPNDGLVYVAHFKDTLIILEEEIGISVHDDPSTLQTLNTQYPAAEIVALGLHSVSNFWSYLVYKDGAIIRQRLGDYEHTHIDKGNPLDVEKALLAKSTVNDAGKRLYKLDEFPDELLTEDQVGEDFVFEISKKYLGSRLDYDGEVVDFEVIGYSYEDKPVVTPPPPVTPEIGKGLKPKPKVDRTSDNFSSKTSQQLLDWHKELIADPQKIKTIHAIWRIANISKELKERGYTLENPETDSKSNREIIYELHKFQLGWRSGVTYSVESSNHVINMAMLVGYRGISFKEIKLRDGAAGILKQDFGPSRDQKARNWSIASGILRILSNFFK